MWKERALVVVVILLIRADDGFLAADAAETLVR
jgi:hypothetical protein